VLSKYNVDPAKTAMSLFTCDAGLLTESFLGALKDVMPTVIEGKKIYAYFGDKFD